MKSPEDSHHNNSIQYIEKEGYPVYKTGLIFSIKLLAYLFN